MARADRRGAPSIIFDLSSEGANLIARPLFLPCSYVSMSHGRRANFDRGGGSLPQRPLALPLAACGFTQAASVGSVMRRYGTSAEKAEAWRALCERDPEGEIVVPPGS